MNLENLKKGIVNGIKVGTLSALTMLPISTQSLPHISPLKTNVLGMDSISINAETSLEDKIDYINFLDSFRLGETEIKSERTFKEGVHIVESGDTMDNITLRINQNCKSLYTTQEIAKVNNKPLLELKDKDGNLVRDNSGNIIKHYNLQLEEKINYECKEEIIGVKPIRKETAEKISNWYLENISVEKQILQAKHVENIYEHYGDVIEEALEYVHNNTNSLVPDKKLRGIFAVEMGSHPGFPTGTEYSPTGYYGFGQLGDDAVIDSCGLSNKKGIELSLPKTGVSIVEDCKNNDYDNIIKDPKKNLFVTVLYASLNMEATKGNIINSTQGHNGGIASMKKPLEGHLKYWDIIDHKDKITVSGVNPDFANEALGFVRNQYGFLPGEELFAYNKY